jgi:hypothetical protein
MLERKKKKNSLGKKEDRFHFLNYNNLFCFSSFNLSKKTEIRIHHIERTMPLKGIFLLNQLQRYIVKGGGRRMKARKNSSNL